MTRLRILVAIALELLALTSAAQAQIPNIPSVPGGGGTPAIPSAPAVPGAPTAPAQPKGLMALLCPSPEQLDAKKRKLCAKPMVQMLNSMMQPMSALTGGMMGSCCPTGPSPDQLAQPADSAGGAASRIKKDEAEAKQRAADVRYLGTVDCRYYPEAQAALINALRADRSECVRIEAARSLGHGCCCNRKTIAALTLAVNGSDKDGNPGERSECVRALAFIALQRCMCTFVDTQEPKQPEPPTPPPPGGPAATPAAGSVQLAAYYRAIDVDHSPVVVMEARRTVAQGFSVSPQTIRQLSGQSTLVDVLADVQRPVRLTVAQEPSPVPSQDFPASNELIGGDQSVTRPATLADVWRRAVTPEGP
jgi:hypothetical protein